MRTKRRLPGTVAALVGVGAVEPSPDGTNVYVVLNGGVAVLARDAATGALTQAPGTNSCLTEWGMGGGGCADGVALMDRTDLALSPDGETLYATVWSSGSVMALDR